MRLKLTAQPQSGDLIEAHNSAEIEWMDLRQLTRYICVAERTMHTWIHPTVGPLPATRIHGKSVINRWAFDAWLQAHMLKPVNSTKRNRATVSVTAV